MDWSTGRGEGMGRRAFVSLFDLRLYLTTVSGGPLAGQVGQRAMTRSLELTVRHGDSVECCREGVVRVDVVVDKRKIEAHGRKVRRCPRWCWPQIVDLLSCRQTWIARICTRSWKNSAGS